MRPFIPIILLSLGLWMGCQPSQNQSLILKVNNSASLPHVASPISLSLSKFPSEGVWAPHDEEGNIIPFQLDDTDGDGKKDELFFLLDVPAKGTQRVTFQPIQSIPDFEVRTHIRLGEKQEAGIVPVKEALRLDTWDNKVTQAKYQFEGPGWENKLVAFRNYLDQRNGMDIFGKTQERLCLDEVGADGAHNYHELDEWGMDVLKVGNSLGAGSVALLYKDSLIRLTGSNANFVILNEGPLRSALGFAFQEVNLGDKTVNVVHGIGITSGMYAYEAFVKLSDPEGIKVVPGLVDLHDLPMKVLSDGKSTLLYTYGLQSANNDSLGMAILVSNDLSPEEISTDDIQGEIPDSYGLMLAPPSAAYRFYAGWERSASQFSSEKAFQDFLTDEMTHFSSPLTLEWQE